MKQPFTTLDTAQKILDRLLELEIEVTSDIMYVKDESGSVLKCVPASIALADIHNAIEDIKEEFKNEFTK